MGAVQSKDVHVLTGTTAGILRDIMVLVISDNIITSAEKLQCNPATNGSSL